MWFGFNNLIGHTGEIMPPFRKGFRHWRTNKRIYQPKNTKEIAKKTKEVVSVRPAERPCRHIYEAAFTDEDLVLNTVPTKLRPKETSDEYREKERELLFGNSLHSNENCIIKISKISELMELLVSHNNKSCKILKPYVELCKRNGLCITLQARCKNCLFRSPTINMFDYVDKVNTHGPAAGAMNHALIMSALKTKAGASDIHFILSSLNIKPPSLAYLNKEISKLAEKTININKLSMIDNQLLVAKVNNLRGNGNGVSVETDTSYNNRPQSGFEAGTQSFCPMIEQETNKKTIIGIQIANKLCSKRYCNHDTDKCTRNHGTEESISSSESKLVKQNLQEIESAKILKVNSVTSDASAQLSKTLGEHSKLSAHTVQHNICFVHHMRTFQKHIKNIKITSKVPGNDKVLYMQRLSSAFRMRVLLELVRLKKKRFPEHIFLTRARSAILNIFDCFSNKHGKCKKHSLACCAHMDFYSPKFLPYGKH